MNKHTKHTQHMTNITLVNIYAPVLVNNTFTYIYALVN